MRETDQRPPVQSGAVHDPLRLRGVLGKFATGVTVVTAGPVMPRGMTVNAFTSVSLQPPTILVCVRRASSMHQAILTNDAFAVSVLSAEQEWIARHFANRARPRGEGEFAVIDWVTGRHTGVRLIADAVAWMECGLAAVYDGGDHSIFLGSVLTIECGAVSEPLLFFGGGYRGS
ncbi:flavin reductase family protein [Amycolatopsis cihanbeyliensis]|uniref:Flavin reductase (DIM6/NTAB) family NADH-FMN oxidoreductase RutF n=1 Tax=Amycolatopsis cihanbeyliensis TaxID=1128664 RepID=A0A542DQ84_AMYCI|nr:flavin reductase family protein [Amycolatopsis cihanbeyliensis]TQJ05263.1 flavin reductase (DIM6/NTAB) family NADH-FMN oxidoreductase RutF [Amycolatopsis cihanbeyliensis]